ncbi:hypothetical protein [Ralstonia phage RSF1]|uniref:Uncharacterized protein n=1 Tax=Ralstonia phage RSF1 TaxID=1689679 RepID=A0A0K2QQH5_9CAUD|nr:hypothetical protein AVU11_gp035 [Ralstonia phage RSF1]BAS04827.1 hypothetical protein [Ralstonia phage RSF1]
MTNGAKSGTIKFLDIEYSIEGLEKAIGKSNETYIEPNSTFHELSFDQSQLPADWREKFRKPIVTQREGKYVLVFMPENGPVLSQGFKAKFITKYNLNQAKPYVAPQVDVNAPIYEAPAPRTFEKKSYDRPKQYQGGGGYNKSNHRYGGRS